MNVTVVGMGYVGLANAVLLARKNHVAALDKLPEKLELIRGGKSPVADEYIEHFLAEENLDLIATADPEAAYKNAELIIVAVTTDYDDRTNSFDTCVVDSVIGEILGMNASAVIVIKSTVPVGYTMAARRRFGCERIIFSPEFLREGKALYDNLYPSRIIVGAPDDAFSRKAAERFAAMLADCSEKKDVPVLITSPDEAEAVKLFSNTYLAMRVAFFNELDAYAEIKGLNSAAIIRGVCLDPRIGEHYNNPSFGYGGYCLPKDSRQLLANFADVPNDIITAVVAANNTRKKYIAERIAALKPNIIGVYRLAMKSGSDNFRQSSVLGIIALLKERGIEVRIYEPTLSENEFQGCKVLNELAEFKAECDIILANRMSAELSDVKEKVYTRDIFYRD